MNTLLAHAGVEGGGQRNAPMSPPLHMATTYTRPAAGPYRPEDSIYIREDNPTRVLLEKEMARIECHGRDFEKAVSCAFASGMMAASSIVLAHEAPLVVILPRDLYHGVPVS